MWFGAQSSTFTPASRWDPTWEWPEVRGTSGCSALNACSHFSSVYDKSLLTPRSRCVGFKWLQSKNRICNSVIKCAPVAINPCVLISFNWEHVDSFSWLTAIFSLRLWSNFFNSSMILRPGLIFDTESWRNKCLWLSSDSSHSSDCCNVLLDAGCCSGLQLGLWLYWVCTWCAVLIFTSIMCLLESFSVSIQWRWCS